MPEKFNNGQTHCSTGNGSFGLILVLLLLSLLAFAFWYPRDDGQTYGDVALLDAQNFTAKVARKTRNVYECATQGCKNKASAPAGNPFATTETRANEAGAPPSAQSAAAEVIAATSPSTNATTATQTPSLPVFRTSPILPPELMNSNAAGTLPLANTNSPIQSPTGNSQPSQTTPQLAVLGAQTLLSPAAAPIQPAPEQNLQPFPVFKGAQNPFQPEQGQVTAPNGSLAAIGNSQQAGKQLLAARQSITQHRYQEAVSLYRKQLFSNPDDIDAYGELGNVLLIAQRYPEAAQNYYEAATRLLDRGLTEAVGPLLPLIEQYEPLLADLLRQKAAQFDR